MDLNNLAKVGYVAKTHGLKGAVKIHLNPDFSQAYINLEHLFIDTESKPVPYFIEDVNFNQTDSAIFQFDDIKDIEQAKSLISKSVYIINLSRLSRYTCRGRLRRGELIGEAGIKFKQDNALVDYVVIDVAHGELGTIQEILTPPMQEIAKIIYNNKEILLPLNEQTIINIDRKKKILYTNIPEGLIEVYLT